MHSKHGGTISWASIVRGFHGSQEFEVHLHTEGAEHETKEMVGADKRLRYESPTSSWEGQCCSRCTNRKVYANGITTGELPLDLCEQFKSLRLELVPEGYVAGLEVEPILMNIIRRAQNGMKSWRK